MNSYYGGYRTRTFEEIFEGNAELGKSSYEVFAEEIKGLDLPLKISDEKLQDLFYLLFSYYGHSHIKSSSEEQFKYRLGSIIYMYGPTWEKRLTLLDDMYKKTIDQIKEGDITFNNYADNPDTLSPNSDKLTPLSLISQQSISGKKKGELEAYAAYLNQTITDVSKEFIDRFNTLFIAITAPDWDLLYNVGG
jgi:hypothetical protein